VFYIETAFDCLCFFSLIHLVVADPIGLSWFLMNGDMRIVVIMRWDEMEEARREGGGMSGDRESGR